MAPDHLQHERAKADAAWKRPAAVPDAWKPWPFDLDRAVSIARSNLQVHINALTEQAKDAIFWGVKL